MSNHLINPPPHPKTPVVNTQSGLINYEWHKWFVEFTRILNNQVLADLGTSSSATTGGTEEPYATHDGNDSPVPYEPEGFVTVEIDGTNYKIPFFNL